MVSEPEKGAEQRLICHEPLFASSAAHQASLKVGLLMEDHLSRLPTVNSTSNSQNINIDAPCKAVQCSLVNNVRHADAEENWHFNFANIRTSLIKK